MMRFSALFAAALAFLGLSGLFEPVMAQSGLASWYALRGRTACGERMNPSAYTAAHRSLPCGTRLMVTHRKTGKSVVVRVTDRGPFKRGRVVDVSRAAGQALGMIGAGVAPVTVSVVR